MSFHDNDTDAPSNSSMEASYAKRISEVGLILDCIDQAAGKHSEAIVNAIWENQKTAERIAEQVEMVSHHLNELTTLQRSLTSTPKDSRSVITRVISTLARATGW